MDTALTLIGVLNFTALILAIYSVKPKTPKSVHNQFMEIT
jgi:hypothetical protein